MRQPLNGDSASPQSLSDSNCYHLGPLFCSLSASVFPNHVSIQKPKCHLCVCVWLQLQSQSFGEQPIKPMRERESFVTSLILLLLLYEIFLTNGTLSLSFPVCVCVILAASSIKIQPVRMWKNGRILPVLHGEREVIAFLSHIQMSGSSGEHEEFEWPWTVTQAHGLEDGKSEERCVCGYRDQTSLCFSPLLWLTVQGNSHTYDY